MKPFSTRLRLILLSSAVVGAGLVSLIHFGGWQVLQAVTLDGRPIENPRKQLGLNPEASVLNQPLESAAKLLLLDDKTARVDIDIDLPSSLHIRTNRFTPVCLVLDRTSGRLLGLNSDGRIVPLDDNYQDWEHPIITGVSADKVFVRCDDPRVGLIVPQLQVMADENQQLYRLIEEIDLSSPVDVGVNVSGLPYELKVSAEGFATQTTDFLQFMEIYQTNIDSSRQVDLRYSNLIFQEALPDTLGDTLVPKAKEADSTKLVKSVKPVKKLTTVKHSQKVKQAKPKKSGKPAKGAHGR